MPKYAYPQEYPRPSKLENAASFQRDAGHAADEFSHILGVHDCVSVAEWLACWIQAQKGPGSNRSRDAVG